MARGSVQPVCVIAVIAAAAAMLLCGCGPIEEGDPHQLDASDRIAQGKAYLSQGQGGDAQRSFHEALLLDPASTEARYGLALADLQILTTLVDEFVVFLGEQLAPPESEAKQGAGDGIGDTLSFYIENIFLPVFTELLNTATDLGQRTDASFRIESMPLVFGGNVVADLGGEWDYADALLILGAAELLNGGLHLILSLDLNFDLGHVFRLPIDFADLSNVDLGAIWRDLVGLVVNLLTDPAYPDFLGPAGRAAEFLPKSGVETGLALKYLVAGGVEALRETDDQGDDILAWVDANGSGVWEAPEPYRLPAVGPFPPEVQNLMAPIAVVMTSAQDSVLDGSSIDPWPEVPTPFDLYVLNLLLQAAVEGDPILIPHATIDLGAAFRDPAYDPAAFKEPLADFLACVVDNEAIADVVSCWIGAAGE